MTGTQFRVERLAVHHNRTSFSCGVAELDRYFREQAGQDVRRNVATVYVLVDTASGATAGYFTLSAASVALQELPDAIARRLPRYPEFPAFLIGRLAVDIRYQGRNLGQALLFGALRRAVEESAHIAAMVVVVDALNDEAQRFYERFGFQTLSGRPRRLFLPIATAARLVSEGL